jgi:hypothetical protein
MYEYYDGSGQINAFNDFRNLLWGSIDSFTFSKGNLEYEECYKYFKDETFDKHFERVENDECGWISATIRRKNEKD